MRTTIRLDDELLREAKRQAAESGKTLTAIIEESLRERLSRGKTKAVRQHRVKLKTTGRGGVLPGIDLDDSSALMDVMDNTR
jgi:predicted transcriptional regulator